MNYGRLIERLEYQTQVLKTMELYLDIQMKALLDDNERMVRICDIVLKALEEMLWAV